VGVADSTSELLSGWHCKQPHIVKTTRTVRCRHHSRVASRFFERVGFDHWTHDAQLGEGRLSSNRPAIPQPKRESSTSKNELWRL